MIEPNTDTATKNASSSRNARSELSKSKCTLVKGPKPLLKFKFYLDIKNHGVTAKLETKIKALGGVIELFLVEEVTHVITDREQCAGGAQSPLVRSVDSLGSNDSPHGSVSGGSLRQKTRADAMLEKVRSQATNKCSDPLQNAKHWGIPIWTVNRVLSWLDKVTASISITVGSTKSRRVKLISIQSPFLKYEPVARDARPVYKTLQSWPLIDLETVAGKPAFTFKTNSTADVHKSSTTESKPAGKEELALDGTHDGKMTRKQRTRLSVRNGNKEQEVEKQTLVGGFCEICHCEYREIGEHVRSEQHLNFVKNDANFLELDTLISAGANVEAFLRLNGNTGKDLNNYPLFGRRSLRKLNGKNTPEKYNGTHEEYSPPVTRNKMPRTRTSSNHSPLSPTGSDSGHHLRSRGQLWLPPNLLGTTAEDEPFSNKAKDSSRKSNCRLSEDDSKNTKENSSENGARPKRTCPKTKRISADERLVADNKTYYKVEVMTTKLRSSGLGNREHELARRAQTPIPEEPDNGDQALVVKFKRVRRSELSVLNDEAENFMFPRKDDTALSDVDTDEAPNTTRSTIRSETSEIKSSEPDAKSLLKSRQELPTADLEDSINTSTFTGNSETENIPRRRRTRNDTRLDVQDCEESNDTNVEVENLPARRRRTRADTKSEMIDLEESNDVDTPDAGRRRTRNETKTDLEDSNGVESVDNFENGRRRRSKNERKSDMVDLDDISESENVSKRSKRVTGKSEQETEEHSTRNGTNCSAENSPTRKRRRVKSENLDVDENSIDHDMELRRKRRKVYTEMDEAAILDESSVDGSTVGDCDGLARRKKRRTQAEAFIADNQRYYRFETPGSRLRYQGVHQGKVSKTDTANKSGCESSDERETVQVDHDHRAKMPRDGLKFSFELLPRSEPWYCTFQRQDRGEEYYTCVSDPGFSNRFYLPYQFPYIIPLDPKVCIEEYKEKKESYIKAEAAKLDVTVDSPLQSIDSPAPSESVTEKSNESDKPLSEIQMIKRRRRRRFLKANSNHPRKSPRQHASTLAILSSLIQQRKKRERKSNGESDTSRASLTSIAEESAAKTPALVDETSQCVSETNSALDTALERILTAPMDDISDLEYHDTEAGIVIRDKPDAIELLENYNQVVPVTNPRLEYQTPQPAETVRVVRRKRKKNRTGWPKKKRLFVKRTEVKSEDGNSSILELEDSRLTELSVEEESGELELCESEECEQRIDTHEEEEDTSAGGEHCGEESRNKLNGISCTGDIKTCSSDSVLTISSSKSEQTNSEQIAESLTVLDSEIQGVPRCTDRLNSVLDNSVQLLASVDNNNSVHSEITVKVKQEGDDSVVIITNTSNSDEVVVKEEVLDIKTDEEDVESTLEEIAEEESVPVQNTIPDEVQKTVLQDTSSYTKLTVMDLRKLDIPCKKSQRNPSSDCSVVEEVIASQTDKLSACVHVALDKWENAEKVLHAKMTENETVPNEKLLQYQPFVRVQKIDNSTLALQNANRRLRSSSSPERKPKAKRAKIMPPSPRSPRKLRAPRGKWYRER